jgi:drug/metabolite transporter (DMT)-like permease
MDKVTQGNSFKGFFYALGGTVLVSTNFITAKYGLRGFNPETFSLIWTSAAAIYAFLIVFVMGQRQQLVVHTHVIGKIALIGFTTGAGILLGWAGLARLDPSFASFLWRFSPVLVITFGALFLGERLSIKELVCIAIMVLGGCISVIGRWHIAGIGLIMTLLACCATAVQRLTAKIAVAETHPNILVFYRVSIGALIIALWTFFTGKADFDVKVSYWLVTLLGAFLGPCASFLLTFRSYRYWDLSRSGIVLTTQPLFVLPLAYLFLGKLPVGRELFGGCLILTGALWLAWIHLVRKANTLISYR